MDNNGHYEPDNLRYATRSQQCRNQRKTKIPEKPTWTSPYSVHTTRRMLHAGMTQEQIIESAYKAVAEKRKNWQSISEKLLSMMF